MKVLVIANRLLGDGLDTFPALHIIFQSLTSRNSQIRFDLVTYRYSQALYREFPFEKVFLADEQNNYLRKNFVFRLFSGGRLYRLWKILKKDYTAVIIFPGGFGWALWARLLRARIIVGSSTDYRGFLLTHGVGYSRSRPNYENFLQVGEKAVSVTSSLDSLSTARDVSKDLGKDREKTLLSIKKALPDLVPTSSLNWRKSLLPTLKLKTFPKKYVVISPTASEKNKTWGGEKFYRIAQQITRRGYAIFWVGLKQEFEAIESLLGSGAELGRNKKIGYNIAGVLDLSEVFALIKEGRGFVGNDSGLAHAATMLGVATVVIYGPGNPTLSRPPIGFKGFKRVKGISGTKKSHRENLCQIYREHLEIPHSQRRDKVHQETLNIDRITAEEAWEAMKHIF